MKDSKSFASRRVGSSPTFGTNKNSLVRREFFMHYVYALSSIRRNYIYVGITSDLQRRISQHNMGYERTTKPYGPFKLIYSDKSGTNTQTLSIECQLPDTTWSKPVEGGVKTRMKFRIVGGTTSGGASIKATDLVST